MPDIFSRDVRSKIMSSIRSKNTKPELVIRRMLWSKGKRYRVHDPTVLGKPDITNRKRRIAVFIDGCFWHGCNRCYVEPKTNTEFWRAKIAANRKRRHLVRSALKNQKWTVLEFWQHDIDNNPERVTNIISGKM